MIRFKMLEGNLMEDYNDFVITYQVIPKGEEVCLVTWTFVYEKKHLGIPEPSSLMDELLKLATIVDDHHHSKDK